MHVPLIYIELVANIKNYDPHIVTYLLQAQMVYLITVFIAFTFAAFIIKQETDVLY